ncbi:MAG: hypothetical protein R3F18_05145 [Lysobacterales bacterium]|nr:hypothetical protein [Xanthomonadales bacterium]
MNAPAQYNRSRHSVLLALAAGLIFAGSLAAQPAQGQGGNGQRPRKPPQEAIDACSGLKAGDVCSFTGRRETLEGTCFAPAQKPLACKPANAPDRKLGEDHPPQ